MSDAREAVDDRELWRSWGPNDAAAWLAAPKANDDKYSRGVLGVLTGSTQYPGAAVLGVEAAWRTGVGMLRYVGPARAADLVLARRPETVIAEGRVQAWLLGSGTSSGARSRAERERALRALEQGRPTVLDAGALDLLDAAVGPSILTPHFRELASLFGRCGVDVSAELIAREPASWARRAALLTGATVLLKGAVTHVAAPTGAGRTVTSGVPWLATAGTGDVLGGILGALLATHAETIAEWGDEAMVALAATGAVLHGIAGKRASAGGPLAALDVAEALPGVIADLLAGSGRQP